MPRVDIADEPASEGSKWVVYVKEGKSEYWYHLLDNGVAHVFKSSDALTPAYDIRDGICSCKAALHSKVCKHVKTVQHLAA